MNNPYQNLYIYYLSGVPILGPSLEKHENFLGMWVEEKEAFLFFSSPGHDKLSRILSQNSDVQLIDQYEMTGEEWHGDRIESYNIESLCISPPWDLPDGINKDEINEKELKKNQPNQERQDILLDPGVVFGTGRHPTTEDCLYLIHRLCKTKTIRTVVDIGTGTGLLALGAAVLGCTKVLACDFNYLAVKTALHNIRLNKLENRILAFQARGEDVMSIPCDLLIANIHYDVMRHLVNSPHLQEKHWLILSGLLNSETKKIMDTLAAKQVHVLERRCPDGVWNTLLVRIGNRD
jgi:ribosomal protein L11 methyltransferase